MGKAKSKTREIMVLGAGIYQLPLIKKVRELGFEALVLSTPGPYPGIQFASEFLPINTTDINSVVKAALERDILGIVTTGTDVCIPAMGAVVDRIGLPGTGFEAAWKSMDKVLMKRCFIDAEVATAPFVVVTSVQAAVEGARQVGLPVMVKATDSSGSRGVTKVDFLSEMGAAWERAVAVSRSPQVIVEKWLSGQEFGAQAFVHGKKVKTIFHHDDQLTSSPCLTPIGHSMPCEISNDVLIKAEELIERAISALGIQQAVANVDLMLSGGEPFIIEIGARAGATGLPENVGTYAGFDFYEHLVELALGREPIVKTIKHQPNASLLLRSSVSGVVKGITIPEELYCHQNLVDLQVDVHPGDAVRKFVVGPDRIGIVIAKSHNAKESIRMTSELSEKIRFEVNPC